jgi:hypothetical protein
MVRPGLTWQVVVAALAATQVSNSCQLTKAQL